LRMMAGQFYEALSQDDDARKQYREGLQHCPKSIELWILAARCEERSSGVTKARSLLELSRLKNPRCPALWLEASRLEARNGNEKGQEMLLGRFLYLIFYARLEVKY
jgi:pre-mRNA-processing factor 6